MSTSHTGKAHGRGATLRLTPTSRARERVLSPTDEKKTSGPEVGGPGALETAGPRPRKACTAESQGDISARGRGRGFWAGLLYCPQPLFCDMRLRGGHGGGVEVTEKEGLWGEWVAQNIPHQRTLASIRPGPEGGLGPPFATWQGRGGGMEAAAQAASTRHPRPGPWGDQVLQSRGPEMRPGTQPPPPKAPSLTWLSCPEFGQKAVGA